MKEFFDENIKLIIFVYFAICIPLIIFKFRGISKWHCTEGVLLNAEVKAHYSSEYSSSFARVKYQYWVDGTEYMGHRLSPHLFGGISAYGIIEKQIKKIEHLPNGKIRVFYNPKKPHKSYLIR